MSTEKTAGEYARARLSLQRAKEKEGQAAEELRLKEAAQEIAESELDDLLQEKKPDDPAVTSKVAELGRAVKAWSAAKASADEAAEERQTWTKQADRLIQAIANTAGRDPQS